MNREYIIEQIKLFIPEFREMDLHVLSDSVLLVLLAEIELVVSRCN